MAMMYNRWNNTLDLIRWIGRRVRTELVLTDRLSFLFTHFFLVHILDD